MGTIISIIWGILTGAVGKLLHSIGMDREQRLERSLANEVKKRIQGESEKKSIELTTEIFREDEELKKRMRDRYESKSLSDNINDMLTRLGKRMPKNSKSN